MDEDSGHPSLLISIVGGRHADLLRRCLQSIPAACGALPYDIAVVENASDSGIAAMVREEFPHVRLLVNSRRQGFSANHNQILRPLLRSPGYDFAVILNDDTELDPGALQTLVDASQASGIGMVGPRIYGSDGELQPSLFAFPTLRGELTRAVGRRSPRGSSRGWLNGSCLVIATETLRRVGPLDERFFLFFEDTDLCRRLADQGLRCVVVSDARVLHHGHTTITSLGTTMELQMLRSRYLYYAKHFGRCHAALAMAIVKGEYVVRALRATVLARLGRPLEEHKRDLLLTLIRYDPRTPLTHEGGS